VHVRGGARCEQQHDPVPACVGEPQLQAVTQRDDMRSGPIRCLSHEPQIADHLTSATEVARDGDPLQLRVRRREVGCSRPKQRVGMVDEALTLGAVQELDPLKHFGLQCRAKAFGRLQPVLSAGLFQVGQRCNAEVLVDVRDLLRRKAWDVQELKKARRHFGPHRLQPGRGPMLMQYEMITL